MKSKAKFLSQDHKAVHFSRSKTWILNHSAEHGTFSNVAIQGFKFFVPNNKDKRYQKRIFTVLVIIFWDYVKSIDECVFA